MSVYLDRKYLLVISNRLPLFKQKTKTTYSCRCPICGDSSKKKTKTRGFFYQAGQSMNYKCHNCGLSVSFSSLLKMLDPGRHQEYILEKFKETHHTKYSDRKETPEFIEPPPNSTAKDFLLKRLSELNRLDQLPDANIAVRYCLDRKIPRSQFSRLYYVDDVKKIEKFSERYKDKIKSHEPRLVIPCLSADGDLVGLTCRDLSGKSGIRYLTARFDKSKPFIFGQDYVDYAMPIFVVEGPIDSLFLPNSLAVFGTGFAKISELALPIERTTLILDNQPRNLEVVSIYEKMVKAGYTIFFWPKRVKAKDVNEYILQGNTVNRFLNMVETNSWSGLSAQAKLIEWKGIK